MKSFVSRKRTVDDVCLLIMGSAKLADMLMSCKVSVCVGVCLCVCERVCECVCVMEVSVLQT